MNSAVYCRAQLQAWEQRWFAQGNSSFGLMQQAAWHSVQAIVEEAGTILAQANASVTVWCGAGNNGGDGWLVAHYLQQLGHAVQIFEWAEPQTTDSQQAKAVAFKAGMTVYGDLNALPQSSVDIDALFGIGLNRALENNALQAVKQFNQRQSYKIALDIPSGLQADSGAILGGAVIANLTLTVLGLKAGLFTGQGKAHVGKVRCLALIPIDSQLQQAAILMHQAPKLPKRQATGHKGSYGHVLIVGGDANMGGAAIMAAEAALAAGAGKVTLLTHAKHHSAAITRCPNVMMLAIPQLEQITPEWAAHISQSMDCIVIGMGLGRDSWGKTIWQAFLPQLENQQKIQKVVVDADGLWHLAAETDLTVAQHKHWYLTPHSGEAGRLLNKTANDIEQDRIAAIYALKEKYGGHWLLKGAGSLTLDTQGLAICDLGNAGMATAGMGDILAGMTGGLLTQFPELRLQDIVALHAAAGDLLAENGERGLQAPQMIDVIRQVVN